MTHQRLIICGTKNLASAIATINVASLLITAPSALARSAFDINHLPQQASYYPTFISQAIIEEEDLDPKTPVGYLIRGRHYRDQRDQDAYQDAINDFGRAIALASSDEFRAIALYNLGLTYEAYGRDDLAIERYSQAIEANWLHIAAYDNLIQMLDRRGDLEKERYEEQRDKAIQALVNDVIQLLEPGQTLSAGEEISFIQRGSELSDLRRYEDAIQLFDAAIALNPNLSAAYNNKARSLEALGRDDEAQDTYQRAIDAIPFQRARLNPSEADALSTAYSNLAGLLLRLGQFEEAELAYDQAIVSDRDLISLDFESDTLTAADYFNLGSMLGEQAQAFERENATDIAERRWERAKAQYNQAITLDPDFAPAYNNLGVYWLNQGDVEQGIDLLQQAIDLSPTPKRLENLAIAWFTQAQSAQNAGNPALAQEYMHNAVNAYLRFEQIINQIEQLPGDVTSSSLLEALVANRDFSLYEEALLPNATNQAYYARYINRLMWLHDNPSLTEGMSLDDLSVQAFLVSERARARGLQQIMTGVDVCQPGDTEELCTLRQEFSDLARQLERAEELSDSESSNRTKELITISKDFEVAQTALIEQGIDSLQLGVLEITLEEVQENLDRDTILLEYWLGDDWNGEPQSYLWAISKPGVLNEKGFLSYRIDASRREINQLAQDYYDYLTNPTQRFKPVSTARAGMELSQVLLGPIAGHLNRLEDYRLVVVADGMLRYIPFNVLPNPNDDQRFMTGAIADVDLDNLPDPLIRNHEIVHLPSFATLLSIRRRAESREAGSQTLAIVTDPGLANTGLEAERILDIAKDEDRDFVPTSTTFRASPTSITENDLDDYRFIHFATHGRVFDTNLAESGLVTSLLNPDGTLTAEANLFLSIPEVFSLDLPADLVVLSACRTGLGEDVTGEGIVGFSQGFLAAGASGVVVSLWSVNDEATRVLMEEFYDELLDNFDTRRNTPQAAGALRKAQLELWDEKRWNLPYYWAGFTFEGEWR